MPSGWEKYTQINAFTLYHPADFAIQTGDTAGGGYLRLPLVKMSFPAGAFKDEAKTNLSEVFLVISQDNSSNSGSICETFSDFPNISGSIIQTQTINGTVFKEMSVIDAAAGNFYDSRIYRTVYDGICYEAALVVHTGNIDNYPPGTVQEFDKEPAFAGLKQVFGTLNFDKGAACTTEAKLCADGSSVGRIPPKCDFSPCPTETSGINGNVLLGPMCPVSQDPPDPQCYDRPYATDLLIFKSDDLQKVVQEFRSDSDGKFRIQVPEGEYVIQSSASPDLLPRCYSEVIRVEANKYSDITVNCDTGIR
jgi:hypothetical protein